MNSVRKQDKTFRRFATIMAALVVLASSAASQRADSSRATSSRSIATPQAATSSSDQNALASSGPSPVNLLTVGQYQTNYHSYAGRGDSPIDVAVGDFNKDGYQDVVVVDQSTCVTFMPGNAQGQLGTPVDSCILPSIGGVYVVAGDFDGDGILDLAVMPIPGGPATVMLAKGTGDGHFTSAGSFTVNGLVGSVTSMASAALVTNNPNPNLDLVVTNDSGQIYVLLGNGAFGFTQTAQSPLKPDNGGAANVGIADFNKDKNMDLAVSYDGEVAVLLGNGDGTFLLPAKSYPMDLNAKGDLAVGDVTGKGNTDIVVNMTGANSISVLLGNGDGTFQKVIDSPSAPVPLFLALADVNGDGKMDAVVASNYNGGDTISVLISKGNGRFEPPVEYAVINNPLEVRIGDFNGDGHPDWVAISANSLTLSVGLGSGTGGFVAAQNVPASPGNQSDQTFAIVAEDFNLDGNLDYAVLTGLSPYPGVNISLQVPDGSGNFAAPVLYPAGNAPAEMTSGVFTKSGYPDIAVLDQSDGTVSVLINNRDGTFASPVSYTVGNGSGFIQTADFRGIGILDLIVTNQADGTVTVLLGKGDGTFQAQPPSTAQANGSYMAIGDFTGDGKLDVAVSSYSSTDIVVLPGKGDGTFRTPIPTTGPSQDVGIVAGDFNKDGKMDLAVASQSSSISNGTGGTGGVQIFLGLGNGSFQAPVSYSTVPVGLSQGSNQQPNPGHSPWGLLPRVGYLNNDGNLDIVIPNYPAIATDTNGIGHNLGPSILLGNGDGTFTLNSGNPAVTYPFQADLALGSFNKKGMGVAVLNYQYNTQTNFLCNVTMLLSASGTEVELTSSLNPSPLGQAVTFTATVVTSIVGLPTPTGTITFELGSTDVPITMVNGVATYTTSTLPVGNTTVYAAYSGDSNFDPQTSPGVVQVVNPGPLAITTTSLPDAVQNVSYSANVTASGGSGNGTYSFTTTAGSLPTGLSMNTSGAITGTPTLPGKSSFTVQVTDSENPPQTAMANLSIIVSSNLQITNTSLPSGVAGDSYSATITATGGTPSYTFTVSNGTLPAGLSLNSSSGVISGTPAGPGTSPFTVQVQDSATPPQTTTASLSITITQGLTITTTSLPNGVQGTSYSAGVNASGGVSPYSFSITTGSLPSGLTIGTTNGTISGTPTGSATSSFTVQAKDSSTPPEIATANLSITIAGNLQITTTSLPSGGVGNSYSATVMASGGTTPYTFAISSGTLPTGLSLSTTTGAISGTPSTPGTSTFTVQVQDSSHPTETAKASLSITIISGLTITTLSLPNGVQGTFYSASVNASGGVSPYTFSITSGSLPTGLTIGTTNGTISGTPTGSGTSSFTVQVKDSSSPPQSATATFSIKIVNTLAITTTKLAGGVVGSRYSASINSGGGVPPVTFSIVGEALPSGLSMSAGGRITGTPLGPAGTSTFTVQAQDSATPHQTATASLSIVVYSGLSITTTSLPDGVQGSRYKQTVQAIGGTTPYTFSLHGGYLFPQGLQMSSKGVISGTISASDGLYNFAVVVQDSSSPPKTAEALLSITVNSALTITTNSLPSTVLGDAYSSVILASGGVQGYTFTISKGSLPGGLTLSAGGAITGIATGVGKADFTVQATDYSNPPQISTARLSITVENTLSITTTTLPNAVSGSQYKASIQATGGLGPYSFSLSQGSSLPPGLGLASKGVITGNVSPADATFIFSVQVQDSGSPILTATALLSITVYSNFAITTTVLPNGIASETYSATLAAKGGKRPYAFSVISTGLPPCCISLSTKGVFSGTISSDYLTSYFYFIVQAVDSSVPPLVATADLSITVTDPLEILTSGLPQGTPGTAYSASIVAGGGTMPYTFSIIGALPNGVSMSTGGVLSGTPLGPNGFSKFTAKVRDSSNPVQTASQPFSILVDTPVQISDAPIPNGKAGAPFSVQLTASGGFKPYTWGLFNSTTLPPGLSLNAKTGLISGTAPAAGFYSFDVGVSDPGGTSIAFYAWNVEP